MKVRCSNHEHSIAKCMHRKLHKPVYASDTGDCRTEVDCVRYRNIGTIKAKCEECDAS